MLYDVTTGATSVLGTGLTDSQPASTGNIAVLLLNPMFMP
jgi:hypothetical protein